MGGGGAKGLRLGRNHIFRRVADGRNTGGVTTPTDGMALSVTTSINRPPCGNPPDLLDPVAATQTYQSPLPNPPLPGFDPGIAAEGRVGVDGRSGRGSAGSCRRARAGSWRPKPRAGRARRRRALRSRRARRRRAAPLNRRPAPSSRRRGWRGQRPGGSSPPLRQKGSARRPWSARCRGRDYAPNRRRP